MSLGASSESVASPASARDQASAGRWRLVRWAGWTAYATVLIWIVTSRGVPTGRLSVAGIAIGGLALTGVGHDRARWLRLLRDWLPFTAMLVAYDQSRGIADALDIPVHESDILGAERWLFGGVEPTVWLQRALYRPGRVSWYDALATLVYVSHFLATPLLAALLWLRDRARWLWFIRRVVGLSVAGLVTYCLFPEAPPWMAARDGSSQPVARLSAQGWIWLHAGNLRALLVEAQSAGSNPVAAMPSLHSAFATLIAITVIAGAASRWRYVAALYPVAMGLTLVYTGEHYVLDIVAGVAYAIATHVVLARWERRRARRPVCAPRGRSAQSGVGVQAGDDDVDDEEVEGDGREAEQVYPRR